MEYKILTAQDENSTSSENADAIRNTTRQLHLESINSYCEFNPANDLSRVKLLSEPEDMVEKSVGWTIQVDCIDGVLRKFSTEDSFTATCSPTIVTNNDGYEVLKFYWDLSSLDKNCGNGR